MHFLNQNVWISLKISLKFVPKLYINHIPALVQIMAWRRSGDKPLSEPMIVILLTHICVTRPKWVRIAAASPSGHKNHYGDVIMGAIASQVTSLTVVYSTIYSDADKKKHQSSASLAFVRGIHRGSANSPHKWPVTQKMFPFDDVIMLMVRRHYSTFLSWSPEISCHFKI